MFDEIVETATLARKAQRSLMLMIRDGFPPGSPVRWIVKGRVQSGVVEFNNWPDWECNSIRVCNAKSGKAYFISPSSIVSESGRSLSDLVREYEQNPPVGS